MQSVAYLGCRPPPLTKADRSSAGPCSPNYCLFPGPSPALIASLQVSSARALPAAAPPAMALQKTGTVDVLEPTTLSAFLSQQNNVEEKLTIVLVSLANACKRIAALLASPSSLSAPAKAVQSVSGGRDDPKPLDIVSNDILKSSLECSGKVAGIASEEEDSPVWFADSPPYVVVFDPLDGSRNIDASIPTGTIFGVYNRLGSTASLPEAEKASANVLQKGEDLVAAGYALYSSATMLIISVGSGTHGFTLDPASGEFVLTHPSIAVPARGQIYSVNDARYFDWPRGLQQYIDDIRQGKGQNPKKYSARYICSLVADLHRTLLYGGIAMNPRSHLRLVYEANPLSFLTEQAGGQGSDGKQRILNIQPTKLHQRLPLFLGSSEDVAELESYGDIQQLVNPGYTV